MALRKKAAKQQEKANTVKVSDYRLLLSPVITEKSSGGAIRGAVFRVSADATKLDIRRAVETIYKVNVTAVNTVNYMGKVKRTQRSIGRRANYKKAYVTLKEGQTINVVEGL